MFLDNSVLSMDSFYFVAVVISLFSDSAFGGYCTSYTYDSSKTYVKCGTWGWSRCPSYSKYAVPHQVCCVGWKNPGCSVPICNNRCLNGGWCSGPERCTCPSSFEGRQCATKICSEIAPCYPGTCSNAQRCTCYRGFTDTSSGCLTFSSYNNAPIITECSVTLAMFRRIEKKEQSYISIPGSKGPNKDVIWYNQQSFNYAEFTMKSMYQKVPNLPPPPEHIHNYSLGIVFSGLNVKHTKRPDDKNERHVAFNMDYRCGNVSDVSPQENISFCEEIEENYQIHTEHDDFLTVTFSTKSGGFRTLLDTHTGKIGSTQIYKGQISTKSIELKFDLISPEHCSEITSRNKCNNGENPIHVANDITQKPIHISWDGWSDSLSGIAYYYLEIFKLEPNTHNELTELEPLKPIYQFKTNKTSSINFPTYYPPKTGMYSMLLQVTDKASNSKIARRLVLYDNDSSITLTKPAFNPNMSVDVSDVKIGDGGMHVITAIPETGYMWQSSNNDTKTRIVLNWENHFVNRIYDQDKLLNRVLTYTAQFVEIQNDGDLIRKKLESVYEKYVNLTDDDGARTRSAIENIHGIVKFEINKVYTDDRKVPQSGWIKHDLSENYEINEQLDDGSHVRLWVRATDIMNHTLADYTEVHIDNTPPVVASDHLHTNIVNGTYTHTSRIIFNASDDDSGVHRIDYKLIVENSTNEHRSGTIRGNRNNSSDACEQVEGCNCVLKTCFIDSQILDIDNCWFLVPTEDLHKSARIEVKVFNQALLYTTFTKQIKHLTNLKGLEDYSGPTNIRVENKFVGSVKLIWDLPEASCYRQADANITLYTWDDKERVVVVYNKATSVDLLGLQPDQVYSVSLNFGYRGTQLGALPYTFKTAPKDKVLSGGVVAGVTVGVLLIVAMLIAIFVLLLKRGHMKPVRRRLDAISIKYKKYVAEIISKAIPNHYSSGNTDSLHVNREIEDFQDIQNWHLDRDDVVLDSLLKSGNFADIYLAILRSTNEKVVAKTLKQNFSEHDESLMTAKINFNADIVGKNENVLQFIGAVVSETNIGPFIVCEYCTNGQMRDYLKTMKDEITVETLERQLRFGLGVVRGMDFLAQRKVVHRRLAARNVLLDADLNPKITGFGPKAGGTHDGDSDKRERIPLKWMAPECLKSTVDATEKSDVWSFGVVLWEIFSFGESPYGNIRGHELPAKLKKGYRLPKPEQCDDKWYGVMKQTWEESTEKRPTFKEIRSTLDEIFVAAPTDDYYYYRK